MLHLQMPRLYRKQRDNLQALSARSGVSYQEGEEMIERVNREAARRYADSHQNLAAFTGDVCRDLLDARRERDEAVSILQDLCIHESPGDWPWSQPLWDRAAAFVAAHPLDAARAAGEE